MPAKHSDNPKSKKDSAKIEDMRSASSPMPAGESREYPRFPFRGRASAVMLGHDCDPEAEPVEFDVLTTDLSRTGVSLLNRKQLYPGQQILLVLNDVDRLIEVRWCCRVWSGLYAAGCVFIDSTSDSGFSSA